jgi:hypothetical protein
MCQLYFDLVVSCTRLGMLDPFDGWCFWHDLSKVCEYTTTYEKVAHGLGIHNDSSSSYLKMYLLGHISLGKGGKHGKKIV